MSPFTLVSSEDGKLVGGLGFVVEGSGDADLPGGVSDLKLLGWVEAKVERDGVGNQSVQATVRVRRGNLKPEKT